MTDYIITEEQIKELNWNCGSPSPVMYSGLEKEIRSHPLEAELKKERERVLDRLPDKIRSDKECIIRYNGFDYIRLIDVDVAVESLRGEP